MKTRSSSSDHPLARTLTKTAVAAVLLALCALLPAPVLRADTAPPHLEVTTAVTLRTDGPRAVAELYADLAAQTGIHVALDPHLKPRDLEIDLHAVPAPIALDRLARSAGHFWVALGSESVFVTRDTPANRRQHQHLVIQPYQLENLDVRDATTLLRALLNVHNLASLPELNTLVIRDTEAKAALASRLLDTLDRQSGVLEVRVEVVALDTDALGAQKDRPPHLATEQWQELRAGGLALASPWLGVAPTDHASFAMTLRPEGEPPHAGASSEATPDGANVPADPFHRLEVELASQLHPGTGEVSLDVVVEWAQGHGVGVGSHARVAQRLVSTLRLESGETYLLSAWEPNPVLDGRALVVALTPHPVVEPQLEPAELEALWVGTEARLGLDLAED